MSPPPVPEWMMCVCMGVLGMDRTDGICGVPMLVMPPTGSRVVIANAAQLHIGH